MSVMIERVARALFDARWDKIDPPTRDAMWADARGDHRTADDWKNARAAIEAMREPTEGMVLAVDMTNFEREDRMHCDDAYTAMIDAALKGPQST